MTIVTFQIHGRAELVDKFFRSVLDADLFLLQHIDDFSFCKVFEVFH